MQNFIFQPSLITYDFKNTAGPTGVARQYKRLHPALPTKSGILL